MPNTRAVVPPSLALDEPAPDRPFSISSIHRTAGATLSATRIALRMFSSDEPTSPPKMRPMSSRSSGSFQCDGDRLGGEALAAALHAQQQQPLRRGQAELARALVAKAAVRRSQPVLEVLQAADVAELLVAW